jgi:hypothetical protein
MNMARTDDWVDGGDVFTGGDSQSKGSASNSGIRNTRPAAGSAASEGGKAGMDAVLGETERRASGAPDGHWGSGWMAPGDMDPTFIRDLTPDPDFDQETGAVGGQGNDVYSPNEGKKIKGFPRGASHRGASGKRSGGY